MNYPQQQSLDYILKTAFSYWKRTVLFQILYSILTYGILIGVSFYFAKQYGIWDQYMNAAELVTEDYDAYESAMKKVADNPNLGRFFYIVLGTMTFLYPLNLGLMQLFKNIKTGQPSSMGDFLSGYQGAMFFKLISFYLLWVLVYSYALSTLVLGAFWVFMTLFSGPLIFFNNRRIVESIGLTWQALKQYYIQMIVGMLVALLFKAVGFLTIFLFPMVAGFSNAMIFTMYDLFFKENQGEVELVEK